MDQVAEEWLARQSEELREYIARLLLSPGRKDGFLKCCSCVQGNKPQTCYLDCLGCRHFEPGRMLNEYYLWQIEKAIDKAEEEAFEEEAFKEGAYRSINNL